MSGRLEDGTGDGELRGQRPVPSAQRPATRDKDQPHVVEECSMSKRMARPDASDAADFGVIGRRGRAYFPSRPPAGPDESHCVRRRVGWLHLRLTVCFVGEQE